MPLESHCEEARATLTAFLISIHNGPQHWYSPMLSVDHPSSFCTLFGLTTTELDIVLESCRFGTRRGKEQKLRFESLAFNNFLSMNACLQSIECASSNPRILSTRKDYWAYLIGMPSQDSFALNFPSSTNSRSKLLTVALSAAAFLMIPSSTNSRSKLLSCFLAFLLFVLLHSFPADALP